VEFHGNNLRGLRGQFAFKGEARNVAPLKLFRLHLLARALGIWCGLPCAAGAVGTGRMISEATFQVLPHFYPIYDHQEWLGRSVLPRIGDCDLMGT
jgi:hypothetical protein